jgi:hypothetical protein
MARFYTNYEISKTDKLLKEEFLLDASKYKTDLKDALNKEYHRVNVDSAKKKAVLQMMNYDGFHQMVLGADLKGIKSKEFLNFRPSDSIMNNIIVHKKLAQEKDVLQGNFTTPESIDTNEKNLLNELIEKLTLEEKESIKENYKSLKKSWKSFSKPEEKISFLMNLNINSNIFEAMLNSELLEADFFLDYLFNMGTFILSSAKNINADTDTNIYLSEKEREKYLFLLQCINIITNNTNFENLKKFIGKKQKNIFKEINAQKEELYIFKDEECLNTLELFINKLI